jgi:hypothetical protein
VSWTFFSAVNGVVAAIVLVFFGWPLARTLVAAMDAARLPEHRVAPQPPSYFFRIALDRNSKTWPLVWSIVFGLAVYWSLAEAPFANIPDWRRLWIALSFLMIFPAFALWVAAATLWWAPRWKGPAPGLAILSALTAAILWTAGEALGRLVLPKQGLVYFQAAGGGKGFYDLIPFLHFFAGGAACWMTFLRMMNLGEKWFRLEE